MTATKRVLVTGAGGFVGHHLAPALHASGSTVFGLGVDPPDPKLALDGWHACDLRDAEAAAAAVAAAKPDAIVHLAAQSSAARSFDAPDETFHVNVAGTWNVLEAARRNAPRARVLVVASGEVYGPQPDGVRATEDTPFAPVSPYALSKATADALAEVHGRSHGLDVIRIRAFGHTGPGQDTRFVVPSFAHQIAALEKSGAPGELRVGNLDVVRDLSDVRDVVRAYVALIERGRSGAAYNVCRGEGVALTSVVDQLVAMSNVPLRVVPDPERMRPADVPRLVGDPGRIAADVGWRAEIPLARTLADVLEEARRALA